MIRPDEHLAFLVAVAARPKDDLPRLVYADALDEDGDPLGELIRVQIDLERIGRACEQLSKPGSVWCGTTKIYTGKECAVCEAIGRERERLSDPRLSLRRLVPWTRGLNFKLERFSGGQRGIAVSSEHTDCHLWLPLTRGFPSAVEEITWGNWLSLHEAILKHCPIQRVLFDCSGDRLPIVCGDDATGQLLRLALEVDGRVEDVSVSRLALAQCQDADQARKVVEDQANTLLQKFWPGIDFSNIPLPS